MKSIKPKIPNSLDQWSQEEMLQNDGYLVHSYEELTRHIAELACENPNLVLFYRGQKTTINQGREVNINQQFCRQFIETIHQIRKWIIDGKN